jgi:eukaryotic-like serine/threonine-protein kinase
MSPQGPAPGEPPSTKPSRRPAVLSMDALPPGMSLSGWTVLRRLAAGGYGTVYAVRGNLHHRGQPRALKLARHPDSPWFAREAEVLSRLRHPGVPRFVTSGTWRIASGDYPFLVMEHVEGEALYTWSRARNASAREMATLFLQAAEVLAFAHQRGVLHRDFKGDNIRVRPDGRLVLLDWGAGWHADAAPLTGTGQLPPGTVHYASPRIHLWRLAAPSTHARECPRYAVEDELYAVGVTFHRLLTDAYPVPLLSDDAPARVWPHPRVPEALATLVTRLLAFRPAARPPSASALASELRLLLSQADSSWDLPLFDWAAPASSASRTTQEDAAMAGPVAPGHEVPLQHARLQRQERIQRVRDIRELCHRIPARVAQREARAIVFANKARRGQTLRAFWRQGCAGAVLILALLGMAWALASFLEPDTGVHPPAPPPSVTRPPASDQAAAPGAALPSHAPLPQEKEDMSIALKQNRPFRALARGCTLAAGAALIGCAGAQVVPNPQRCPQEALSAMKKLMLRRDSKGIILLDVRYPDSVGAPAIAVRDGDIVSRMQDSHGRLPEGTLLYGRLWTGGEMIIGRYTRAETPDGHVYPVCFVLGNEDPQGWWKGATSKPGAPVMSRIAGYTVMDAFP